MCRLIGFASPVSTTLTEQIGAEQVNRFRDMSTLHRDGWGSAWLEVPSDEPEPAFGGVDETAASASEPLLDSDSEQAAIKTYRTTDRAPEDPVFTQVVDSHRSFARVVHLRWATEGLAIHPENTHPFVADGIALAHNGSISPLAELEAMLSPDILRSLHGRTDSERYLAVVRQELADEPDPLQAVARAVIRLRRHFPAASLNALVLSETTLMAVHASAASPAPVKDMLSTGMDEADLPLGHLEGYFLMRWRDGPANSLIFSSSGLHIDGWHPLPPESITSVDLATMRTTVRELTAG